jgi:hypothetical protein
VKRLASIAVLAAALVPVAAPHADGAPFRGKIEIRHSDDFAGKRTHTSYRLRQGRRSIPLILARAPRTPSGSKVTVHGRRSGSRIRGTVRPRGNLLRAATVSAGTRKTAVILINFAADTRQPFTPATVRQRVFTATDSTSAFYAEESYGDVSLTGKTRSDGDVYGWYTIAAPAGDCTNADVDTWAQQAQAAAAADGFSATGYQHVIYVFPQQAACGWAGLGELPGEQSWMNGTISTRVVAHELGHNMGLHHSSSIACTSGGAPVAYSATCTRDEYGDPFDVMGNRLRRNGGWHLRQIGFMPSANVQTVNASGTYQLTTAIARGSGTQLLRVPQPGTTPRRYYDLDLRAAAGVFDNFAISDPAVQGVTIRVDPEVTSLTQSLLVDTTPGSASGFADAPLVPGRTFSDGTVAITVTSVVDGVATIEVGVPTTSDVNPPTAPSRLTATPSASSVALSWRASVDDVGVAGYRVYRDGVQVASTTATAWTDSGVSPGSGYSYRVDAYDAAGNSTSSLTVRAVVPAPPQPAPEPQPTPPPSTTPVEPPLTQPVEPPLAPADSVRPRVRIVSPGRGSRVRRRAVVRALAFDDSSVVRSEVWVDGKRRKTVNGGRVAWRWPLSGARRGVHSIVVKAFDASGNGGRSAVRVRVLR